MLEIFSAHNAIEFSPLIDTLSLYLLTGFAVLLCLIMSLYYGTKALWRIPLLLWLCLVIWNPSLREEDRKPLTSSVIAIVDQSPSQIFEDRSTQTKEALSWLEAQITKIPGLELEVIYGDISPNASKTKLYELFLNTIQDRPQSRVAGVFWVTDGQIHDVPRITPSSKPLPFPVHGIITGKKQEKDRVLKIIEAPSYGIVGKESRITLRVDDIVNEKAVDGAPVQITLKHDTQENIVNAKTGQDVNLILPITHAGQNVFILEITGLDGEISKANNTQAIVINGVRDRLKVLLVSGQPHNGGRMWRNILTSDPSVDLVHFTILRDPSKRDNTPQSELSLIAFPIRELFEVKLYDFDLVIFDRFSRTNILPPRYFSNIANYVLNGGAFLESSGPGYASDLSIFNTSLNSILPTKPKNLTIKKPYLPKLSQIGKTHPVTSTLAQLEEKSVDAPWVEWYRQVDTTALRGDVLMNGVNEKPLLILDRVGEGRVAQFTSDHLWLWARGHKDGGPQAELLKRTIHWLMKEPDLEENALSLSQAGSQILIKKRHLSDTQTSIDVTKPDGVTKTITMNAKAGEFAEHILEIDQLGVYTFRDKDITRYFVVGDVNPKEYQDTLSTTSKIDHFIASSKGKTLRLEDMASTQIQTVSGRRKMHGYKWLGVLKSNAYKVTSTKSIPLLPDRMALIGLIMLAALMWWRESKS